MAFQDTFKALSDPVRRDILVHLKSGSMSAGEICRQFDMTAATISYHLSLLKKAELVRETKCKNFVYYELNASVFEELMLWIKQFGKSGGIKPAKNDSTKSTKHNTAPVKKNITKSAKERSAKSVKNNIKSVKQSGRKNTNCQNDGGKNAKRKAHR
ncbi:MAG: winged helix-turn-helix transcriptional regulator [Treponema sp.]|nr:winged helix-turn-helix transcriptional regulator [Treponema sp.]